LVQVTLSDRAKRAGLGHTTSLCPRCSRILDANTLSENGKIFMEKTCPEHGAFRSLVWNDEFLYKQSFKFEQPGKKHLIRNYATEASRGCPLDCGLCPEHRQHTCFALVEVTNRCNLRCPVCYASANEATAEEPSLAELEDRFRFILSSEKDPPTLQLTGGEPTVRPDFPEIVKTARKLGFTDITLSTNGVTLAKDSTLAVRLAKAGLSEVTLQFDGVSDDVYVRIRGIPLLREKIAAIKNLQTAGLNIAVAATLLPGINTAQIGDIIRFAKQENLDGVNFSPMTYVGRYPDDGFNPENRLTIPDVLREIEAQTEGKLKVSDFVPVPCPDTVCSTMTYAFNTSKQLVPLTRVYDVASHLSSLLYGERVVEGELVRNALLNLWSMGAVPGSSNVLQNICDLDLPRELLKNAKCMSIAIHGFQDAWNIDFDRVKKCCIHIATSDKKLIPFCVYNNLIRPELW
jgi:uncharacterized radical SAM superfamily Fe-S cluster-containing enzyme